MHLNLSVDIKYSIVGQIKVTNARQKHWVNYVRLWDKSCSSIFLIFQKRVCLGMWKLFRTTESEVRYYTSLVLCGLRTSKILFAQGHMKLRRLFSKIPRLAKILIFKLSLFHSNIVEG